jgi:uncharacterized protein (DUF1810 family)
MGDYDLGRFVAAQEEGGTYRNVVAELRTGRKTTHWMWFIFPQIAGLGSSPTARRFAISSLAEAEAYLRDPVLGPRLLDCAEILTTLAGQTAENVFGSLDAVKLRSSMTLFARAGPGETVFQAVLEQFFGGTPDDATERLIGAGGSET